MRENYDRPTVGREVRGIIDDYNSGEHSDQNAERIALEETERRRKQKGRRDRWYAYVERVARESESFSRGEGII